MLPPHRLKRALARQVSLPSHARDDAFRAIIHSIPRGHVSTYGRVAAAAGYPMLHRAVAHLLGKELGLPWQRVVGAGGEIKTRGDHALEQRARLEAEGVRFRGQRVEMARYEHTLRPWLLPDR